MMPNLTPDKLAEMEATEKAASVGGWDSRVRLRTEIGTEAEHALPAHVRQYWVAKVRSEADRVFIARVRTDAPLAYAEIRRAWKRIADIEKASQQHHKIDDAVGWTAWLIEGGKANAKYLTGGHYQFEWTDDPLKAIHFVRRQDADAAAFGEDCWSVREHEFVGTMG